MSVTSATTPEAPQALDLAAFARPVPPVRFPNGNVRPLVPFSAESYALFREAKEQTDVREAGVRAMELLRRAIPEATAEDWATLDEEGRMAAAIMGAATNRLNVALAAIETMGNAVAAAVRAAAPVRPPRSAPPTRSRSSAAASRPRTAKASARSSSSRTTKRS